MFKRRLRALLIVIGVTLAAVVARLAQLQLGGADVNRRRAEEFLLAEKHLQTVRARILDRRDRVLALDEACFDFCLDYRVLAAGRTSVAIPYRSLTAEEKWVRQTILRLARQEKVSRERAEEIYRRRVALAWDLGEQVTGVPRNEMVRAAEEAVRRVEAIGRIIGRRPGEADQPHPVITGLDEAAAVALRDRLGETIGASVAPSHHRRYPFVVDSGGGATAPAEGPRAWPQGRRGLACHVIGRVAPVTREMLEEQERRLGGATPRAGSHAELEALLPGDQAGVSGVERLCEDSLRGRRGYRRWRRSDGATIEERPIRLGADVQLTIDIELDRQIAEAYRQEVLKVLGRFEPGSVVVLDVPTGEVLAMVSLPGYDLNTYGADFRTLADDETDLPLLNRSVAVRYPPGSTCKPLAALAALGAGVVQPGTPIECRGWLVSPTYPGFRCWIWKKYHTGHGTLDMGSGLEKSCNVYFFTLGEWLGLPRLREWYGRFGQIDPPGTLLPEERGGMLPDPAGPEAVGKARLMAIGQALAITPMHVANAMATIARGGEFRTPRLVRSVAGRAGLPEPLAQRSRRLPLSPEAVEVVQRGMHRVVNATGGTAYAVLHEPEAPPMTVEICGKTGTAETPPRRVDSNGDGRIDAADRTVKSGDTAWFAGFAPYRKPRVAFAVMVEYSSESGGKTCGHLAARIVNLCREAGYLNE